MVDLKAEIPLVGMLIYVLLSLIQQMKLMTKWWTPKRMTGLMEHQRRAQVHETCGLGGIVMVTVETLVGNEIETGMVVMVEIGEGIVMMMVGKVIGMEIGVGMMVGMVIGIEVAGTEIAVTGTATTEIETTGIVSTEIEEAGITEEAEMITETEIIEIEITGTGEETVMMSGMITGETIETEIMM